MACTGFLGNSSWIRTRLQCEVMVDNGASSRYSTYSTWHFISIQVVNLHFMKELIQLDQRAMLGKPVVTDIHPDNIPELRKKVLDAVNLIE